MREEKPRADEIELRLELALADVCQSKFDVADLLRRRFAPRQLDLGLVNVHPDDPAPGLDQAREIERNVAASTANVQTRHSRTDAHSLEQAERRWPHDSRQDPQPFPSFNAATDDVVRLFHALVPRSRVIVLSKLDACQNTFAARGSAGVPPAFFRSLEQALGIQRRRILACLVVMSAPHQGGCVSSECHKRSRTGRG
ncbi:MAG: hypothetical protein WBC04_18360 [Candidatus Acidiferrales bacterium]